MDDGDVRDGEQLIYDELGDEMFQKSTGLAD